MEEALSFLDPVGAFLAALLVLVIVSFGSERVTEIIKTLLRFIANKVSWLEALYPEGAGSWLLALVPAYLLAFGFDVDVLADFEIFANVDEDLVQILNHLIIWGMSNVIHPKLPPVESTRKK